MRLTMKFYSSQRFFLILCSLFIISMSLSSCAAPLKQDTRKKVVVTLFPQYDIVRALAKDKVALTLLLPPGVEAHDFEPSPKDVVLCSKADLFIYTNDYMETWAKEFTQGLGAPNLRVLDVSKDLELLSREEEEAHEADSEKKAHDEHGAFDPHVWLSPANMVLMTNTVLQELTKIDPENAAFYTQNALQYKEDLNKIDAEILSSLQKIPNKTLYYAGHFTFGYFAKRYGLNSKSAYAGFSSESEPGPKAILDFIVAIKNEGVKTIFFEELIDPKIAKTLAQETGVKIMLLHGCHNLSKEEIDSNITYLELMANNLKALQEGL